MVVGAGVVPGRGDRSARAIGAWAGVVGLLLLTGLLGGCAPAAGTGTDTRGSVPLVQPLGAPGTVADSPRASPRAEVPRFLLGGSWGEAFRLGSTASPPAAPTPPASPGREMTAGGPTGAPVGTPAPDPRRVVQLPTGVGSQAPQPAAAPRRVQVPRLGIDSDLDALGLRPDGELQAPPRWQKAGWYTGGPRPGETGPAVIAGHLDSPVGPAVFAALPAVRPGDRVVVTDVLGATHTFEVQRVTRTPKVGFPTEAVYGAVPGSELRLITCTGSYLAEDGGYQDNLLVFATLVTG